MSDEASMQRIVGRGPPGLSTLEIIYRWFLRMVACYSLLFGLMYWIRLIGIYPGAEWRFDLMSVHWQVASVSLAALFPFAASGLWMLASWGPVIWFLCASIEILMHVGLPDLYGVRWAVVASHMMVAVLFGIFHLLFYLTRRKEAA